MPSGLFIKTITLILLYLLKKKKEMLYFKKSRAGKKKKKLQAMGKCAQAETWKRDTRQDEHKTETVMIKAG